METATPLNELSQAELDELAEIYAEIYADFHEGDRATPESIEAAVDKFASKLSADQDESFANEIYSTRIIGFWH